MLGQPLFLHEPNSSHIISLVCFKYFKSTMKMALFSTPTGCVVATTFRSRSGSNSVSIISVVDKCFFCREKMGTFFACSSIFLDLGSILSLQVQKDRANYSSGHRDIHGPLSRKGEALYITKLCAPSRVVVITNA